MTELISPATYALADYYQRLGLRILTLPVVVALVLTMIWRQVASATTLVQLLARESVLWVPSREVAETVRGGKLLFGQRQAPP